ncbi:hypothetical protein L3Q72_17550 [Vibrio sp. JC009]|uniref:hypothetical protein n=1 Tax=Vibrio sp. JC009 TaxID=2912314 RepID=UPI0023B03336|nr:hypothetical protein [Vibrio sp. JC009]WED24681.1 hypothetical protein L3Q72_17550 [Vibrio sp. JC009]
MKLKLLLAATAAMTLSGNVLAHTALMACYDEGNGYINCEGGFSDGASAEGVEFRIEQNGSVIMQTKLDEFGEVYFEKPAGDFTVVLNGGEGHVVHIDGKDISE